MNKTDLLLQMMEQPHRYTADQWQEILADDECRELYTLMSKTQSAVDAARADEEITDEMIDAEWQRFTQTHLTDEKPERSWLKIAATFIGILMISGIAFAAIHIIRHVSNVGVEPQAPIQETIIANSHQLPADTVRADTIPPKVVRYEEATLKQILTDMADYYGLTLNWKSEEAKTLRLFYIWNKQQSAEEVITSMNSFERISLQLNDSILTANIQTSSPK
jgi:hypothetical protein